MLAMLFADDFVGLSDSEQGLQALIDVVYAYSKKWRFEANVAKCAVVVFRNEKKLDGTWTWGDSVLPHLNYYTYYTYMQWSLGCTPEKFSDIW